MKTSHRLLAMAALIVPLTLPGVVQAKGCVKGAAVGGVAGHVAGGHGVLGAAAGCAIGHHRAEKKDEEKQDQSRQDQQGSRDKEGDARHASRQGGDEDKR